MTAHRIIESPPPPCEGCGDDHQDSLFRIQAGGITRAVCIACLYETAAQSQPGEIRIMEIIEWIDPSISDEDESDGRAGRNTEMQVWKLVAERRSNKEIGASLRLAPGVVREFVGELKRKNGARSRSELISMWKREA